MYKIQSDEQFALDLLRREKVLVVQGSGFNWPETGYFRLVFLARNQDLKRGTDGIARLLERYRKGE